jgi:hypothetical protein
MRILIITGLYILLGFSLMQTALAENTVTLEYPPASLQQWYKPANKRQVWLHTMFRLRRSMLAVEEYAHLQHGPAMQQWAEKLREDYEKITEMVPEWEDETKPALMDTLMKFIKSGDTVRVHKTLRMIGKTCTDCHDKYGPLVAALNRSPDYKEIKLLDANNKSISFHDSMGELSRSVNRILIATDDGHKPIALMARDMLSNQLTNLGESCGHCHKDKQPHERILGTETQQRLEALQVAISEQRTKETKKLMGEIGVTICARCHGVHRTVFDLRKTLIR